eukprot:jgi/Pico_ML_1/52763/g3426.t1
MGTQVGCSLAAQATMADLQAMALATSFPSRIPRSNNFTARTSTELALPSALPLLDRAASRNASMSSASASILSAPRRSASSTAARVVASSCGPQKSTRARSTFLVSFEDVPDPLSSVRVARERAARASMPLPKAAKVRMAASGEAPARRCRHLEVPIGSHPSSGASAIVPVSFNNRSATRDPAKQEVMDVAKRMRMSVELHRPGVKSRG